MEAARLERSRHRATRPVRAATWPPERQVVRFGVRQRLEHLTLVATFIALAATGVPQKFAGADMSQWIIAQFGGIDTARFLHRVFAVAFMILALEHVAAMVALAARRQLRPTMAPAWSDVQTAVQMIRYSLGLDKHHPRFDRYDYRQKFEYWGIIFGTMVMIMSGLILWFPILATRVLPGQFVAAAREAHSNEALLALSVVIVWHLYSVILSPTCFPGDFSIFTGRIAERRLLEEHPVEHQRLVAEGRIAARASRAGLVGRRRRGRFRPLTPAADWRGVPRDGPG